MRDVADCVGGVAWYLIHYPAIKITYERVICTSYAFKVVQ